MVAVDPWRQRREECLIGGKTGFPGRAAAGRDGRRWESSSARRWRRPTSGGVGRGRERTLDGEWKVKTVRPVQYGRFIRLSRSL